jgi:hypothetical protein
MSLKMRLLLYYAGDTPQESLRERTKKYSLQKCDRVAVRAMFRTKIFFSQLYKYFCVVTYNCVFLGLISNAKSAR